jgi:hypothetical protein
MRIRRSIIAPTVLTIGTIGSLIGGPIVALTTAAPAVSAVAVGGATPNIIGFHM